MKKSCKNSECKDGIMYVYGKDEFGICLERKACPRCNHKPIKNKHVPATYLILLLIFTGIIIFLQLRGYL